MIRQRLRYRELKCDRVVVPSGYHIDRDNPSHRKVSEIVDREISQMEGLEQLRKQSLTGRPDATNLPSLKCYTRSFTNIYMIICKSTGAVKIGRADNVKTRLSELQVANPFELAILSSFRAPSMFEGVMHAMFSRTRLRGEWFSLSDDLMDMAEIANDKDYSGVLLQCREILNRSRPLTVSTASDNM